MTTNLKTGSIKALAIQVFVLLIWGSSFTTCLAYIFKNNELRAQQLSARSPILSSRQQEAEVLMNSLSTSYENYGRNIKTKVESRQKTIFLKIPPAISKRSRNLGAMEMWHKEANSMPWVYKKNNIPRTNLVTEKIIPKTVGRLKLLATCARLSNQLPFPNPKLAARTTNCPERTPAANDRTPMQIYARPYKATGKHRIAIVISSLGMSEATTMAAIQNLPGSVTLGFAPYGRNLQEYVNKARAAGHEVLLQVPMEPKNYPENDPGPHTLLTSISIDKNLNRLEWLLNRFTGYVGVVNYMGERFTSAEIHLRPVLNVMKARGLMFFDLKSSPSSVTLDLAKRIGLHFAINDRIIDKVASRSAIDTRLQELERLAQASGGAIGVGFPYPVTIERLVKWTNTIGHRGFDLVPISALSSHRRSDN